MNSMKYITTFIFLLSSIFAHAAPPDWSVNPNKYAFNMTVTGVINLNFTESENTNDIIAAFVNDECRGVAQPVFREANGRYICYLMIYSNQTVESITFKVYNANADQIETIPVNMDFAVNGVVGNAETPYIWANPILSNEVQLLKFGFLGQENEALISDSSIRITVSEGTDLAKLIPVFELSEGASLFFGGKLQQSGVGEIDFSEPVVGLVLAEDNKTQREYFFTVIALQEKLPASNAITPDGDNLNDFWIVENVESYAGFELYIFNTSGLEVYKTTNYQNDWDGTYKGNPLPKGTYYYLFRSNAITYKGIITILRK